MNIRMKFLIATALFMNTVGIVQGRTLRIPADYETIGEAVIAARANDTVLVRSGVYRGSMNDSIRFTAAITLLSEEGPGQCIIDAEGTPDSVGYTLATGVKVNGFTFTRFAHNPILASNVQNIRISNCFFFANVVRSANTGGQVKCVGAQDPIIEHCIFQENAAGTAGAAIQLNATTVRAKVWDCIFNQNETTRFGGAIAIISNSTVDIGNCIFTGNFAGVDGGGIAFTQGSSGTVHNSTFINNAARNGGGGGLYKGSTSNPVVINSIFWENSAGTGNQLWQQNQGPGAGGTITISYCCIQGGVEEDGGYNGDNIIDQAPWFAEGREPLWGLNFFYLDPDQSSCINAGSGRADAVGMDTLITNPDLSFDQGRVDLGFHYDMDSYLRLGNLRGYVLSALSGQGVWGCRVTTSRRVEATAEESGFWRIDDHRMGDLWVNFHHEAFLDTTVNDLYLEEDGELDIRIEMLHTDFASSIQEYVASFDSGTVDVSHFTVANNGSGVLTYSATPQLVGGANLDPWTLRETLPATTATGDIRLNGAVYVDSLFYVSGANGDSLNMIWILDRQGALVDSFPQIQMDRYGVKNLTWGADLLWCTERDSILGYDRDGNLQIAFETTVNPIECIAYDSDRDVLWISGISTDITAINRDGSDPGLIVRDRNLHRKYGMVYWPQDPDGKCLYFIHRSVIDQQANRHFLYKVNPDVPIDTVLVTELIGEGNPALQGACIADWDIFSVVFITLANVGAQLGGDRIEIRQLAGNTSWMRLEPNAGEVMPQAQQEFTFTLDLANFPIGRYEGQLFFTHNALDNQFILPIVANLRHNGVGSENSYLPSALEIKEIHPNPFNGMTSLKYSIPVPGLVKLGVYDLAGREVARLINGQGTAGEHSLTIDAENWASGVYIAKLEAAGAVRTAKLVLMR